MPVNLEITITRLDNYEFLDGNYQFDVELYHPDSGDYTHRTFANEDHKALGDWLASEIHAWADPYYYVALKECGK